MKAPLLPLLVLALLSLGSTGEAASLEQSLVARWAFEGGTLKSVPEGFDFNDISADGNKPSWSEAFLHLFPKTFLYASDVNVRKVPDVAQCATLITRLRFDDPVPSVSAFPIGLVSLERPGDWKTVTLVVACRVAEDKSITLSPYAILEDGTGLGIGPSRAIPVQAGVDYTVAVAFDGRAPHNALTLWVNGVVAFKDKDKDIKATRLQPFEGLALGRLTGGSPSQAVSVSDIRLYSVALTPEWIEEIATPESSSAK